MFSRDGLTCEKFDSLGLVVFQPQRGHRYGKESLALGEFCRANEGEHVVELGSGSGVISLLVAARDKPEKVVGVEIQGEFCAISRFNVSKNCNLGFVEFVNQDWRIFSIEHKGEFDLVFSNPPFFAARSGRISPDSMRAAARHELNGTVFELAASAKRLLKSDGRFVVAFPKDRTEELMRAANNCRFILSRERSFNSFVLREFIL